MYFQLTTMEIKSTRKYAALEFYAGTHGAFREIS